MNSAGNKKDKIMYVYKIKPRDGSNQQNGQKILFVGVKADNV